VGKVGKDRVRSLCSGVCGMLNVGWRYGTGYLRDDCKWILPRRDDDNARTSIVQYSTVQLMEGIKMSNIVHSGWRWRDPQPREIRVFWVLGGGSDRGTKGM
jgi:hypothetical protein